MTREMSKDRPISNAVPWQPKGDIVERRRGASFTGRGTEDAIVAVIGIGGRGLAPNNFHIFLILSCKGTQHGVHSYKILQNKSRTKIKKTKVPTVAHTYLVL